jgi:ectoine hydroxylase-related dioxygenase (phytanoyl-CoA dioxygenase family)
MSIPIGVCAADIEAYRRDGAVLIRSALDADMRALIERGVEEAYRSPRATTKLGDAVGENGTVVRDYASLDSPALQAVLTSGALGRVGAALMQTPSAQIILDQIFYKQQGVIIPTPWHQDTPFLRVRGESLIRLWTPCDRSPRALTVQVVRGSHRWNVVYSGKTRPPTKDATETRTPSAVGDSWLPAPPDVAGHRDSFDIMTWDVEPGDILAFQGNMLHGADGHPGSDRPRRALAVLMGGPNLRYYKPGGKAFPSPGRMAGNMGPEDIRDGAPIGEHQEAFPLC